MERITVEGKGSPFSHEHADYPYAQKAPYNEIWITGADCVADAPMRSLAVADPHVYGTLGEFIDLQIEASEMSPAEASEILEDLVSEGEALIAGFVGTGFVLKRIDGPESVLGTSAAPR